MKKRSPVFAVDVSRSLFMDLAFLLVAALVLMVRESSIQAVNGQKAIDAPNIQLRVLSSQEKQLLVDPSLPGQSLECIVDQEGSFFVRDASGHIFKEEPANVRTRFEKMPSPRVAVLMVDERAPYGQVALVKDALSVFVRDGSVNEVVERVEKKHE